MLLSHLFLQGLELLHHLDELLTRRELHILHHVIHGLSNKEIAARLFVAECTIITHRENIYRKLSIKGKNEIRVFLNKYQRAYELYRKNP